MIAPKVQVCRFLKQDFNFEATIDSKVLTIGKMMTARATKTALLGLILLTSVDAFGGYSTATSSTLRLRPTMMSNSPSPYSYPRQHRLYAAPSSPEELENNKNSVEADATPASAYAEGDPRQALEQFGSLFEQVKVIFTEGRDWDSDKLEEKTREFVRTYVSVFVPGMGYVATSLAVYTSSALVVGTGLELSGRGYADVLAAATASGFEPLRVLLEKEDPSLGNVVIVLVLLELLTPVIVAATLALTPKTTEALRSNLDGWGWGEDGINDRVSEMLGDK
jgi:hypothetical protein